MTTPTLTCNGLASSDSLTTPIYTALRVDNLRSGRATLYGKTATIRRWTKITTGYGTKYVAHRHAIRCGIPITFRTCNTRVTWTLTHSPDSTTGRNWIASPITRY